MTPLADHINGLGPARLALTVRRLRARSGGVDLLNAEPIAVIGMGLRFPGGARDAGSFWRLLREGHDAISEVPLERWDVDALYDARPGTPGRMSSRYGGFIENADRFDAPFFATSPREAMSMDPQHRLLLEVAWHALQDAGQSPQAVADSLTGVFVGITTDDYAQLQVQADTAADIYSGIGVTKSAAAGRLSYVLGLHGPSVAIDTACSSSLVAVHLACQSLQREECRMALAGGVNLLLSPLGTIQLSQMKALAPDGRCKTFDASADGFVRAEGCGLVVLKRLSDALADGDRVLALIRGSATNHDGRSGGLTVPNGPAQEAVVRAAIGRAGISPSEIGYVEAHGSGTSLGDPIEAQALGAVLREGRDHGRPAAIGSVKTNLGHLEAAAGVAGLIKTILVLAHREIPPHLHLREVNPHIGIADLPLTIPTVATPWSVATGQRRYAGVSAFGLSGTNAHIVLEEAPEEAPADVATEGVHLLPLSAHSPAALGALAKEWVEFLSTSEGVRSAAAVCRTAGERSAHHAHRLGIVGRSHAELGEQLSAFLRGESSRGVSAGTASAGARPKVVFVFPGQGSQWIGMARSLSATMPAFRDALARCDEAMRDELGASLVDELGRDAATWRLDRIDLLQPALFAIQVALAATWRNLGVVPDAVIGHSMGEVAAAHVAGALSLEDACRIICRRSRLLRRVSGRGAMALVDLPLAQAQQALQGREANLSIAASNSQRSTVIAGEPAALDDLIAALERADVFCRRIKVDVASHSPQMDPLRPELLSALSELRPIPATIRMYSTVDGGLAAGPELAGRYWADNLRRPVLFGDAVTRAIADGYHFFVELSPHPIVVPSIEQVLADLGTAGLAVGSLRRDEDEREVLLGALGALYAAGLTVEWSRLYPESTGRPVALPLYPFQGERYWFDDESTNAARPRRTGDLLGDHHTSAAEPDLHVFERDVDEGWMPWLGDHRVHGTVLLPAAATLDLALRAADQASGAHDFSVEEVRFEKALPLPQSGGCTIQLSLRGAEPLRFALHSRPTGAMAPWQCHVTGVLRRGRPTPPDVPALAALEARCAEAVSTEAHYSAAKTRGLDYGPAFRGLDRIHRGLAEATAVLCGADLQNADLGRATTQRGERISVPTLDAAFQALGLLLDDEEGRSDDTWLPVGLDRFVMHAGSAPAARVWSRRTNTHMSAGSVSGDVLLLDEAGGCVAEVHGLRLQRLAPSTNSAQVADSDALGRTLHEVRWQDLPALAQPHAAAARDGLWLLIADRTGVADGLAERLRASGARVIVERPAGGEQGVRQMVDRAITSGGTAIQAVVHLAALDATAAGQTTGASFAVDQPMTCDMPLHLVQALVRAGVRNAPRLWFVTRGAQAVASAQQGVAVAQAALWGLGRVVAHEHPELRCARLDLDPRIPDISTSTTGAGSEAQMAVEQETLLAELIADGSEDEVALRDGKRFGARIVRAARATGAPPTLRAGDRPFRIEIPKTGVLDDVMLREIARRSPAAGEVEIQVHAAGLNFLDVLKALGVYPGQDPGDVTLGGECAGTVVAVGDGVDSLRPGDEVIAAAGGAFATHITIAAHFAVLRPARLDVDEAATVPLAFMTAWYALHHVARLQGCERVLIHSATGGTGMAALQIALALGAEPWATAGSEERRTLLRSLGVRHVYDSRSTAFAAAILRDTANEGVDVVLNSLAGDGLSAGVSILRPYGRFVDLSKRDLYQGRPLDLGPFRRGLSYTAIDLAGMATERPALFASLLHEVAGDFAAGRWRALPIERFSVTRAAEAMAHMAQARHVGKIALTLNDAANTAIVPIGHATLRAEGSYLVTGGLGGLGLRIARVLVERGARHLVLVGRSAPSVEAETSIAGLRAAGAQVIVEAADVSRHDDVARAVGRATALAPLRGIVHTAAVLDDGTLLKQTPARFASVLGPKAVGALHLHHLSAGQPLDFFVLFSSAASLLGSPGQANYSAANACLDALAHHRRALGLPALSINWGPWSEVGLAAQAGRGSRIAAGGIESFTPDEGMTLFARLLDDGRAQVGAMSLDARRWSQSYPQVAASPLLSELLSGSSNTGPTSGDGGLRSELTAALPAERSARLTAWVREQIARVLRVPPARIEPAAPLGSLGFDSLTALELRNRIEAGLGLRFSATLIWAYPTLGALAAHLDDLLFPALQSPPSIEVMSDATPVERQFSTGAEAAMADLSDEAAEALLLEKLASLEEARR